ncbi:flippase [Vibrio breoganii]
MFKASDTVRRFFKNASWLIFGKLYRVVLVTITTIYLSRYLGPENFGLLNYSISIVIILSFLIGLGLESIIVKEVHKPDSNSGAILSSSILLRFFGWCLFFCIVVAICFQLKSGDSDFLKLMVILSVGYFFKIFEVFRYFFEAKVMGRVVSSSEIIAVTISCLSKFYFIQSERSLEYFFYASVLDVILLSIFLMGLFFKYRNNRKLENYLLKPNKQEMSNLFHQSWPLIFASGLYLIYSKIDQVMLGEIAGMHAVGVYAAAVKLSEGGGFIFSTLAVALYPLMLKERNVSQQRFSAQTKRLLSLMVVLSVSLALIITLSSSFLTELIFGDQYKGVDTVLSIHVWGAVFIAINAISAKYLVTEGLQKHSVYKNVIGILINVGLNYLLIPIYGVNGAAFATVISHVFSTYLYFLLRSETRQLFYMQSYAICLIWLKDFMLNRILKGK